MPHDKGVCDACQRVDKMHECFNCSSNVCLTCMGLNGCKDCKTRPQKRMKE